MEIVEFIQKFILLLLPGIIGVFLFDAINIRVQKHYYFEFLRILCFSIAAFCVSDGILWTIKKLFPCFILAPVNIIAQINAFAIEIPVSNEFIAIVTAIVLSGMLTKAHSTDLLFKIAYRLNLSRRVDNAPVWENAFNESSIVVIRDQVTKNTYYGRVDRISDNSDIRELLLHDVRVYNDESELLYHTKSVYMSRCQNEFTIEVFDYDDNSQEDKNNG